MRAIRTATICHSDDDHNNPRHRRVKLELLKTEEGYTWFSEDDECGLGAHETVADAEDAARAAWGSQACWAFRARWA